MENINGWSTPPLDVARKYIEKCKLFVEDDEAFANFRRDPDYGKILEGNEEEVGLIAMNYLHQHGGASFFEAYKERFKENDAVGNPPLYENGLACSTIRYANTAFEIMQLLGNFNPRRIIEIGGGYGGLCKIL